MPNGHHEDYESLLPDIANYPIVANSVPPKLTREPLATQSWILELQETLHVCLDSSLCRVPKLLKLPFGGTVELNRPDQGASKLPQRVLLDCSLQARAALP